MAQQGILAQEDARIGLQGVGKGRSTLRSRLPSDVFRVLEAQDGEYLHWTVFADMETAVAHTPEGIGVVVGYIIAESDAKPRDLIAEKKAGAAKKSAKKGASKKAVVKVARPASGDDDPFAEEDDGSAPAQRRAPVVVAKPAATVARKVAPVAAAAARKPVAVAAASGRVPRVQGAIAKPGIARKGRGVRYNKG